MADENRGRCVGCGYLSWRRHGDDQSPFYEVTTERRANGEKPVDGEPRDVSPAPYCRRLVPIHQEFGRKKAGKDPKIVFLDVIRGDRNCAKWERYEPGESPEAHMIAAKSRSVDKAQTEAKVKTDEQSAALQRAEMIFRGLTQTEQRDWEDAREGRDRDWQSRQKWQDWARAIIGWIITAVVGAIILVSRDGCVSKPTVPPPPADTSTGK